MFLFKCIGYDNIAVLKENILVLRTNILTYVEVKSIS